MLREPTLDSARIMDMRSRDAHRAHDNPRRAPPEAAPLEVPGRELPGNANASDELVAARFPNHPRAEELRALRTQLLIRWFDAKPARATLAIVSPGSGEGRSYTIANLAVVFSQIGVRTLLIDADLRAPRLHRIFDVSAPAGLAAALAGTPISEAIVPVPGLLRLSLMPAGQLPLHPQELLSRPRFADVLDEARRSFDLVLLDTPAAGRCSDAQMICYRANNAMLLARRNRTRVDATKKLMRDMKDTGVNLVGTVINSF